MHTYLMYVLGSAMGLKAACTTQRVLVYTKEFHERKALFALVRCKSEWDCIRVVEKLGRVNKGENHPYPRFSVRSGVIHAQSDVHPRGRTMLP